LRGFAIGKAMGIRREVIVDSTSVWWKLDALELPLDLLDNHMKNNFRSTILQGLR
jgi:hypothetical protein